MSLKPPGGSLREQQVELTLNSIARSVKDLQRLLDPQSNDETPSSNPQGSFSPIAVTRDRQGTSLSSGSKARQMDGNVASLQFTISSPSRFSETDLAHFPVLSRELSHLLLSALEVIHSGQLLVRMELSVGEGQASGLWEKTGIAVPSPAPSILRSS